MGDTRENRRTEFKPDKVKVLFIGESPPANPKTFFYLETGALFRYTREAFNAAGAPWAPDREDRFLEHFRDLGCYLEDLCAEPGAEVNCKRRDYRSKFAGEIKRLSEKIHRHDPEKVIVVIKRIERCVVEALSATGRESPDLVLDFPVLGRQNKYRERLTAFLKQSVVRPREGEDHTSSMWPKCPGCGKTGTIYGLPWRLQIGSRIEGLATDLHSAVLVICGECRVVVGAYRTEALRQDGS
jgi:hypothetical protein